MGEREGPVAKRWEGEGLTKSRFTADDGTVDRARRLRRDATPAEKKLWSVLRGAGLGGFKFRRQQRLGPFIADFACQSARLVIEVDGDSHAAQIDYDARRTDFLAREGYRVLRFTNREVMSNLDGVCRMIEAALADSPSPSHATAPRGPLPLPQGERGL
ncbi:MULTISPECIES: endonuclease domain-containing protein [unclassified Sphingopyxis]|uniref:endonuclease domain-containing protein n=1 Tax=unclassified Sphingopyxis TaxID=2614943 RepID=UPI0025CE40D0|nr:MULTISPECIES: endonuclease domain-containing protein [unclassified Sphingopyxis]